MEDSARHAQIGGQCWTRISKMLGRGPTQEPTECEELLDCAAEDSPKLLGKPLKVQASAEELERAVETNCQG